MLPSTPPSREMPDCPGAIMPEDPLAEGGAPEAGDPDMGDAQYWRCSACDMSMPQGSVMSLLRRVGEDLADMDKDDPESCRLFLERYGGEAFPLDLKVSMAHKVWKAVVVFRTLIHIQQLTRRLVIPNSRRNTRASGVRCSLGTTST